MKLRKLARKFGLIECRWGDQASSIRLWFCPFTRTTFSDRELRKLQQK
jgi:hypothetical protein